MKFKEKQRLKGHVKIFLINKKTGEERLVVDKDNLIVTTGKTLVRNLLSGDSSDNLTGFAFGTGTTTPAAGDTDLENAVPYSGTNKYKAFQSYTHDSDTKTTYIGWFASTEPVTQPVDLTEVGLFTSTGTNGGIMYCRTTFDAISKTSSLELRLEYSLEF